MPANGSSPLSRGILWCATTHPSGPGIIPALAGNTPHRKTNTFPATDHPRSRGEYCSSRVLRIPRRVSSPLSRGILKIIRRRTPISGIIPALAGNTRRLTEPSPGMRDHPRSRGEYELFQLSPESTPGSSPLSRGIRGPPWEVIGGLRIIPALAGNTAGTNSSGGTSRDHPRSRGEYFGEAVKPVDGVGSSPLSRGIRPSRPSAQRIGRIIPALAGNTGAAPPAAPP